MTPLPFRPAIAVELPFVALADAAEALVKSATGCLWMGRGFFYPFLIAFALLGPSEIVFAAPLNLGLPPGHTWLALLHLASIMLVSATGKASRSVFAFHIS